MQYATQPKALRAAVDKWKLVVEASEPIKAQTGYGDPMHRVPRAIPCVSITVLFATTRPVSKPTQRMLHNRLGWSTVPTMRDPLVPAGLDDASALELLRRQDALQAEARGVLAELDLVQLLSRAGR